MLKNFKEKASKSAGILKQQVLQKVGAASATQESPEFHAMLESLHATSDTFTWIAKLAKPIVALNDEIKAENKVGIVLENVSLVMALEKKYKSAVLNMDSRKNNVTGLEGNEKTKPETLQAAKVKLEEATDEYNSSKKELELAMEDLEAKRDEWYNDLIETMCRALQDAKPDWKNEEGARRAEVDEGAETDTGIKSGTVEVEVSTDEDDYEEDK